jgi:hypothetical protein
MFLNTQHGSIILAGASRREVPEALPLAHRIWDSLVSHSTSLWCGTGRGLVE